MLKTWGSFRSTEEASANFPYKFSITLTSEWCPGGGQYTSTPQVEIYKVQQVLTNTRHIIVAN